MVGIDERKIWASDETQIAEPPTALQEQGYAPLEQPYNEHHNQIWNSRDKDDTVLIHKHNIDTRYAPNITIDNQVKGNYVSDDNPAHPWNLPIQQDPQPLCICRGWIHSTIVGVTRRIEKECVYLGLENVAGVKRMWNKNDGTIDSEILTLDFNDSTEYVEAIACEENAMYVMTRKSTGGDVHFYRFSLNPFSATPIWSTPDNENLIKDMGRSALCITDEWIAYIRTNVDTFFSQTTPMIRLIRKSDAGAFLQGNGNANAIVDPDLYPGYSLVTNGTELFFSIYDDIGTNQASLCGCDIADPTQANNPSGPWLSKSLRDTEGGPHIGDLICDGPLVHIASTNGLVFTYYWETDVWAQGNSAQWKFSNAKPTAPDRQEHAAFCYDGRNGWLLTEFEGTGTGNNAFIGSVPVYTANLDDVLTRPFQIDGSNTSIIMVGPPRPSTPRTYNTKMVHADNSLWALTMIGHFPLAAGEWNIIRVLGTDGRR